MIDLLLKILTPLTLSVIVVAVGIFMYDLCKKGKENAE